MVLTKAASNRAAVAISRMINLGESLTSAARAVATSRRTVFKYAKAHGIKLIKKKKRWVVVRTPSQKIREFLELMLTNKYSAAKAAKSLHTTVETMKKQKLPDMSGKLLPIIVKKGNNWTPNFLGVREYSMTLYGGLIGVNNRRQGRGHQAGPKAKKDNADDEYADIWWQVDFNSFKSTLPINFAGSYWSGHIMDYLRKLLETPKIKNSTLATKFLGNPTVNTHAVSNNRIKGGQMLLTKLEDFTERYDMKMTHGQYGIEPVAGLVVPITFVSVADFPKIQKQQAAGSWAIMYLTKSELNVYPIKVLFKYDLSSEI